MSRRSKPTRRKILPDVKYNSEVLANFINRLMRSGKKSVARRVTYGALAMVEDRAKRPPMEVPADRRQSLAMRWLIAGAKTRGGRSMAEKLAGEILDAANNAGAAVKKKEETHKVAE